MDNFIKQNYSTSKWGLAKLNKLREPSVLWEVSEVWLLELHSVCTHTHLLTGSLFCSVGRGSAPARKLTTFPSIMWLQKCESGNFLMETRWPRRKDSCNTETDVLVAISINAIKISRWRKENRCKELLHLAPLHLDSHHSQVFLFKVIMLMHMFDTSHWRSATYLQGTNPFSL